MIPYLIGLIIGASVSSMSLPIGIIVMTSAGVAIYLVRKLREIFEYRNNLRRFRETAKYERYP